VAPPLSPQTRRRLDRVFAPELRAEAEALLVERCGGNLPLCQHNGPLEMERIRFAALKLSEGELAALRRAVDLAYTDWRDLLMEADFGHDPIAHHRWLAGD